MFNWLFDKKVTTKRNPVTTSISGKDSKLITLIILDGFGIHPDPVGNAVLNSKTPFLDTLWTNCKSTLLSAAGKEVGLPDGEAGNSEVGHLNIGSGQIVTQSLTRINDTMAAGKFNNHPVLGEAFSFAKRNNSKVHLFGILSAGGVHGHIQHLFNLMTLCRQKGVDPYIHAILDGRDSGLTDGYYYVSKLKQEIKSLGIGTIASLAGRFYSMDRDTRWERIELAYNCMVGNGKRKSKDVYVALQEAYKSGENDQIFIPTTIVGADGEPIGPIRDNDVVIFYNFREDRAREITKVFVDQYFESFERKNLPQNLYFVTMTGYEKELNTHVLFPPKQIQNTIASVLSRNDKLQLHVSETEKYAHVTYFFNGGVESRYPGELWYPIPSPKVFDYAKVPEMSAGDITAQVLYSLENITKINYSFILLNFANPDMVGHTGNYEAAIRANEYVDKCVKDVVEATLKVGGNVIIIADHGNCETMLDRVTLKVDTAHTTNPVPFIYVSDKSELVKPPQSKMLKIGTGPNGEFPKALLADVAPTVLKVLGLDVPEEMTGLSILDLL